MNKHHKHTHNDKNLKGENTIKDEHKEVADIVAENNSDKKADAESNYDHLNDKYIRLLAEFENFKKRNVKERIELISIANQDTIIPLLSILDDFDRAFAATNSTDSDKHQHAGFLLIHQKLKKILEQKGLKEMDMDEDLDFSPELHEAIAHVDAPEDKKNKVIDIIEKGYYLNTRLIRHAKVVVGK